MTFTAIIVQNVTMKVIQKHILGLILKDIRCNIIARSVIMRNEGIDSNEENDMFDSFLCSFPNRLFHPGDVLRDVSRPGRFFQIGSIYPSNFIQIRIIFRRSFIRIGNRFRRRNSCIWRRSHSDEPRF